MMPTSKIFGCCDEITSRAGIHAAALYMWLVDKDIVFIVGLYKTGTSLAVDLCGRVGFADPSRQTNPTERGYGLSLHRYLTRECRVLRSLNEALMTGHAGLTATARFHNPRLQRSAWRHGSIRSPETYLFEWHPPIVLKDPRFVFTLPRWIVAASHLFLRAGVIFTYRPPNELLMAWDAAPLTRELLMRGKFAAYSAAYDEQLAVCHDEGIPHVVLSLQRLRQIDTVWTEHQTELGELLQCPQPAMGQQ